MSEGLYSLLPGERLEAARAVNPVGVQSTPSRLEELPESVREDARKVHELGDIFSPINAWLLFVGPSYGGPPISMEAHNRVAGRQWPTLGVRHPNSLGEGRTLGPLRRWSTEAFRQNDLFNGNEDDAWTVSGMMNLSGGWAGKASDLASEEVRAGLPKFWGAIEILRPRLVVALDRIAYDAIDLSCRSVGAMKDDEKEHRVPAINPKTVRPSSAWIKPKDSLRFLLARAPNHPAKMNFQIPDETYRYLAMQVRRAMRSS